VFKVRLGGYNWLAQGGMEWGPIFAMCNLERLTQCKALLEIVIFLLGNI
jgi:hypothetical protein